MKDFSLKLLGTASGIPTLKRNNVSIALNIGDIIYILDTGEQCAASFLRNDMNFNKVRAIFISHMDVDHFAGLPMLLKSMILWASRKEPLKVFVPENAIGNVKACLNMMYLLDEVLGFSLEILPINQEKTYNDENISISFYGNKHIKRRLKRNPCIASKYPDLQQESFSFCLQTKHKKIIYSGDLASLDELDSFIQHTDVFISEFAHFPPEDFFEYVSDKNIKKIILLHIHPDWDEKEDEILAIAHKYGTRNIEIGNDNLKINL
jgi:ribonuclease BN (tRNA processing enzyme)